MFVVSVTKYVYVGEDVREAGYESGNIYRKLVKEESREKFMKEKR